MSLNPTLWRTCRSLANRQRLQLLRLLFRNPGFTVQAAAEDLRITPKLASQYLRNLNARGLITARRQGRYVCYFPEADPEVSGSRALLEALRSALSSGRDPLGTAFHQLTAFTHSRRIAIVQCLRDGARSAGALKQQTQISQQALDRHLLKLHERRVIARDDALYRLATPRGRLATTLLTLACGSEPEQE